RETGRQFEKFDVYPGEPPSDVVTVTVTYWKRPAGASTAVLKDASPAASAATRTDPRGSCPSPKPLGSQTSFAKTSISRSASGTERADPLIVSSPRLTDAD